MAAQQGLHSQPHARRHPEPLDRFIGILRTGWLEPAASGNQHGQIDLVNAQREQRDSHADFQGRGHHTLRSNCSSSAVSVANGARTTALFGCMTMSHPAGISRRWQRTISRMRRRIRLRTTAPPSAFLMLKPKRLSGNWLAPRKTVNWQPQPRFPARYTASNSPRRTSRAPRGNSRRPGSLGSKAIASLLAARRQNPAAALRLHARAEAVRLCAAPPAWLKCALWQNNPPISARPQSAPLLL